MRILHISDLHFGIAEDETDKVQRNDLFNNLIEITSNESIEFVVVTGDIAFKNRDNGYKEAKLWLTNLSKRLGVGLDHFLLCPGNHDLDRNKCVGMDYISERDKVNNILKLEHMNEIERRFHKYIQLCEELGVAVPKLNKTKNYLNGIYIYKDICFLVLNTAWFAFNGGAKDKGYLWIGQPLLDIIIHDYNEAKKVNHIKHVISMSHHPKEWLNDSDIYFESYVFICNRSFVCQC